MKREKLEQKLVALLAMSAAELKTEWERVFRTPAPPAFVRDLLARGIAYRLQERVHGGLSVSVHRQLKSAGRQGRGQKAKAAPVLRPGARLVREWHGRTHHVLVSDTGFLYNDRVYRSLTQIAHDITGAKWSGPRFFGLRGRIDRRDMEGNRAAA